MSCFLSLIIDNQTIMAGKCERHLPYFAITEALEDSSFCFLCKLELDSLNKYFDTLFYEQINDVGVRKQLAHSKGFCSRHSRFILRYGESLGTAILYNQQCELFNEFLKSCSLFAGRLPKMLTLSDWMEHKHCPACAHQVKDRKLYSSVFLDALRNSDSEMIGAFEKSAAICVPHFLYLMKQLSGERKMFGYLIEMEQRKFNRLRAEVNEFIRKSDYKNFSQQIDGQQDICRNIIRVFAGYEGLF